MWTKNRYFCLSIIKFTNFFWLKHLTHVIRSILEIVNIVLILTLFIENKQKVYKVNKVNSYRPTLCFGQIKTNIYCTNNFI